MPLWNPKVQYHVHTGSSPNAVLSQINLVYIITTDLGSILIFSSNPHLYLPSSSFSSDFLISFNISHFLHASSEPCLSHHLHLISFTIYRKRIEIMTILVREFSPASPYNTFSGLNFFPCPVFRFRQSQFSVTMKSNFMPTNKQQ